MKMTLALAALLLLAGCTPHEPIPFQDASWTTNGDPVTWQKMGAIPHEGGLFRYIDKETGIAVYITWDTYSGSLSLTSQKVGK